MKTGLILALAVAAVLCSCGTADDNGCGTQIECKCKDYADRDAELCEFSHHGWDHRYNECVVLFDQGNADERAQAECWIECAKHSKTCDEQHQCDMTNCNG